jgi:hypothetical protein
VQHVYEDCTRRAWFSGELGNPSRWVDFGKELPAVLLNDTLHNPEEIIKFAKKIGAIFEGKYIIVVGDGRPRLYTDEQARKLLHA